MQLQQTQFYVAHSGEQLGPFTLEEMLRMLDAKTLDLRDYLFDEQEQDWVMLMAFAALSEKMKSMKPAAPPRAARVEPAEVQPTSEVESDDSIAVEWFVLKGENKYGPFTYFDLIKMLQTKNVFEHDYVWHNSMRGWMRVAEIEDFRPQNIRKLKDSNMPELTEVFFRRRHMRVAHGASLLVHDNNSVWKGHSMEISAGGAGIIVENAFLQPGQTIYLHFKPGDGLPPFNAVCEIISKKFIRAHDEGAVQYGVKFIRINQQTQKSLESFTEKQKAA